MYPWLPETTNRFHLRCSSSNPYGYHLLFSIRYSLFSFFFFFWFYIFVSYFINIYVTRSENSSLATEPVSQELGLEQSSIGRAPSLALVVVLRRSRPSVTFFYKTFVILLSFLSLSFVIWSPKNTLLSLVIMLTTYKSRNSPIPEYYIIITFIIISIIR